MRYLLGGLLVLAAASCTKHKEKVSLPSENVAPDVKKTVTETADSVAKESTPTEKAAAAETTKADEQEAGKAPAGDVSTSDSKPGTAKPTGIIAASARLTGVVEASRKAQLSFRVSGYLQHLAVKEGDFAKKGDLLAKLDPRDFKLRFDQASARMQLATILAKQAEKDFDREKKLLTDKVATDVTFDRATASRDQAVLNARLAQLDVENAKSALDDSSIVAPYDLVVGSISIEENEFVHDGNVVMTIHDLTAPEIRLDAPERLAGSFEIGNAVLINIPAANFSGKAEIIRIVPIISEKTRTFTLFARILGEARLAPGSYAEAVIN